MITLKDNLPVWARWTFLALFVAIIAMGIYIHNSNIDVKVEKKVAEKKAIEKTIDTLNDARTNNIDKLVKDSKIKNEKAKQIIKSISHEKTIIPDTTNAAMVEYITNYKFNEY